MVCLLCCSVPVQYFTKKHKKILYKRKKSAYNKKEYLMAVCLPRSGQARIGNQVRILSRPATVLGEPAFIMPLEQSGKAKACAVILESGDLPQPVPSRFDIT